MVSETKVPAIRFASFSDTWEQRRFQNCSELPEDMFLRLLRQIQLKQTRRFIQSIHHRPKIMG